MYSPAWKSKIPVMDSKVPLSGNSLKALPISLQELQFFYMVANSQRLAIARVQCPVAGFSLKDNCEVILALALPLTAGFSLTVHQLLSLYSPCAPYAITGTSTMAIPNSLSRHLSVTERASKEIH